MKAATSLGGLQEAIAWAARALAPANEPLLSCLRLRAGYGELEVAGFDGDTAAVMSLQASVTEPGIALLPGRLTAKLAGALSGQDAQFWAAEDAQEGSVELRAGGASFTLRSPASGNYPVLHEPGGRPGHCDGGALARAITRVLPAAGGPKSRAECQAVHLASDGAQLAAEATNTFQAARAVLEWEPGDDVDALIPLPAAGLLRHLSEVVSLRLSGDGMGMAVFSGGGRQVWTRLIAGRYPDVARFFAAQRPTVVTAPAGELLAALKATSVLLDSDLLPVELVAGEDGLSVSAPGGDLGSGTVPVAGAEVSGPAISLYFQPARLVRAISGAGEVARLALAPKPTAALVTPAVGDGYEHIVMPFARPKGAAGDTGN